ncbi:MAG: hypothetical protein H0U74_22270 [Bradymonadaceae bacterium]|nr:hypothetical protein [Lujinxingiaceae bacterium]
MHKLSVGLVMLALVTSACSDEVSQEDAQRGWAAANLVLALGQAQAQTRSSALESTESDFDYSTTESANGTQHNVNYSFSCLEGGKAAFVGKFATHDNGQTTFSYDVSYDGCRSQSVVIDGALGFSLDMKITDSSTSLEYVYNGTLDFSGEASGTCAIDLIGKTSTSFAGGSDFSYQVSYSGSVCGHDADLVASN